MFFATFSLISFYILLDKIGTNTSESRDALLKYFEETPELSSLYSDLYTFLLFTVMSPATPKVGSEIHSTPSHQKQENRDTVSVKQPPISSELRREPLDVYNERQLKMKSGRGINKLFDYTVQRENKELENTLGSNQSWQNSFISGVYDGKNVTASEKMFYLDGQSSLNNISEEIAQEPKTNLHLISDELKLKNSNIFKGKHQFLSLDNDAERNNFTRFSKLSDAPDNGAPTPPLTDISTNQKSSFEQSFYPGDTSLQSVEVGSHQPNKEKHIDEVNSSDLHDTEPASIRIQHTTSPSSLPHYEASSQSQLHDTSSLHFHDDTSSLPRNLATDSFLEEAGSSATDVDRAHEDLQSNSLSGHVSSRYMSDHLQQLIRLKRHLVAEQESASRQDQHRVRLIHPQRANNRPNGSQALQAALVLESLLFSDHCLVYMFNCSDPPNIHQCSGFGAGRCIEMKRVSAPVAYAALAMMATVGLCFIYFFVKIMSIEVTPNQVGDEEMERNKKMENNTAVQEEKQPKQ